MKNKGRKFGLVIAAVAGALCVLTVLIAAVPAFMLLSSAVKGREEKNVYDPQNDAPVLRLHIIANSDSERDQSIKLAVRDAVLEYERSENALKSIDSAFAAENLIREDGAALLNAVRAELRRQGADYDAQLMIGNFDFPQREYGNEVYPAGSYRALRILLGSARGRNWWCIMFPPLCIIDTGSTPQEDRPVRFESLLVRVFNWLKGAKDEA